jgi:hypothetical protein
METVTQTQTTKYSLAELTKYFLKLGTVGFGGPVALIGYMHRDLVEDKKWISEDEYREGRLRSLPRALWLPNLEFIWATCIMVFWVLRSQGWPLYCHPF